MYGYLIYILLFVAACLSAVTKKLTVTGAITGFIVAFLVYKGSGYTGIVMLALFFVLASVATNWKIGKKQQLAIAERDKGKRTAGQVIANGGAAAILGGIGWLKPELTTLIQVMIAGSFAAAIADTLSSELGSVYGRKFYDIITFKTSKPGPDGVISMEGTLIGVLGATIIAVTYAVVFGFNYLTPTIILAGAIGNLFDSILGATLERKRLIGNNVVNFLNTLIGALVCLGFYLLG